MAMIDRIHSFNQHHLLGARPLPSLRWSLKSAARLVWIPPVQLHRNPLGGSGTSPLRLFLIQTTRFPSHVVRFTFFSESCLWTSNLTIVSVAIDTPVPETAQRNRICTAGHKIHASTESTPFPFGLFIFRDGRPRRGRFDFGVPATRNFTPQLSALFPNLQHVRIKLTKLDVPTYGKSPAKRRVEDIIDTTRGPRW